MYHLGVNEIEMYLLAFVSQGIFWECIVLTLPHYLTLRHICILFQGAKANANKARSSNQIHLRDNSS